MASALVLWCLAGPLATASGAADENPGPVALITGGSTGIGFATAKVLAASGYQVVITARSETKLQAAVLEIEAAGGAIASCIQDVTIDESYDECFDFAEKHFGSPVKHVFFNAGAAIDQSIPFEEQPRSALKKIVALDFTSVLIGLQKAVQIMLKNDGGSIVFCSSIVAGFNRLHFDGRLGDLVAHGVTYGTSKTALDYMARAATFYAPKNIRVYSLRPNCYDTPALRGFAVKYGVEDLDAGLGPINLFFNTAIGDPQHLGYMVQHFFDNTTQYPVGANVIADHDATYDGAVQYDEIDNPTMQPHELHSTILPKLRGYDGGPYKCTSEYTCQFVKNIKAKIAGREDL